MNDNERLRKTNLRSSRQNNQDWASLEGLFSAFHRAENRGYMLSIGFAKCNTLKCKSPVLITPGFRSGRRRKRLVTPAEPVQPRGEKLMTGLRHYNRWLLADSKGEPIFQSMFKLT